MLESLEEVRVELERLAEPDRVETLQRFFKTGPGEYGEGDRFLGVRVPHLRRLARQLRDLPGPVVEELLRSTWHEERFLALVILVDRYRRGTQADKQVVHDLYLAHTEFVNSWDLVDASAEHILGAHVDPGQIGLLESLARSESVWERRMGIIATFHWIKRDIFAPTLRIAEMLLEDEHDLIHKAVGWMLREVGKRDRAAEEGFLRNHYGRMPRTMLRYAIEHLPKAERVPYLRGEV